MKRILHALAALIASWVVLYHLRREEREEREREVARKMYANLRGDYPDFFSTSTAGPFHPPGEPERDLKAELSDALEREDYERAAEIRDRLKKL